jgi:arylsulfatase A-like enzyme
VENDGILSGFDEVISDPPTRDTASRNRTLRADRFVAQTIAALEKKPLGSRPLLLWSHFIEPHAPYNPVPDFPWGATDTARYDAEIRYTDRAIGHLLDGLERAGIAKDALFVLFADHGEEFGEHGFGSHGHSLYRAGTHVPLLFWGPGVRPGRYRREVALLDLLPTVLGMLRIRAPRTHGTSLARTIASGAAPPLRTIGSELYPTKIQPPTLLAAQRDGWKLVAQPDMGPIALYRVSDDPLEKKNLLFARRAVRDALRSDLAAIEALAMPLDRVRRSVRR